QAEDGIRDRNVTGVQTCALPIYTNGQRTLLLRDGSNNGCSTCTSAAALTGSNEDKVCASECVFNFGLVIFSRGTPHLWVCACAQAAGELASNIELYISVGKEQSLGVSVDSNELNALEALFNHAVNGVYSATTDTDYLDVREVITWSGH